MNDRKRLKDKIISRVYGKAIKRALNDAKDALRKSESAQANACIAINEAERVRCLYIERDSDYLKTKL